MAGRDIRIESSDGGAFDCYLALPDAGGRTPAVVLACAVHGVDDDVRAIADEFAAAGYIAAAPDLFWRTVAGPLPRGDERSAQRAQPRLEKIRTGEADMADTLAAVRKLPQCSGRVAAMGFCYGGPYALIGPARLGYDAGISCHGTQLLDFIGELDGLGGRPLCIIWGDQDHAAPPAVRSAYLDAAARMRNVQVHVFPGVVHGYMMRGGGKAYSAQTYAFSMRSALAMLDGLRGA